MDSIQSLNSFNSLSAAQLVAGAKPAAPNADELSEREAFDRFVGGTFFRQLLGAMQKSVGKPAYFHGGQAEEMFRSQLNETLADKMAEVTADQFTGPMYELFQLSRQ
ncbi:MAG TPA: rod-binding protein [Pirellulales bacterium]|jgi:flagellar protein FlgJ|nr:rod-binding protein [Pirellulales bacterium]